MGLDFVHRCNAEALCEAADLEFSKVFRYQYRITKEDSPLSGFQSVSHKAWHVQAGPDLLVTPLLDLTGASVGYLLGVAICHDGRDFAQAVAEDVDTASDDAVTDFEAVLGVAIGRFAIVIDLAGRTLFYQDASGTIGAVQDDDTGVIASSLHLCLNRAVDKSPLFWDSEEGKAIGHLGAHFTEDARVRRLNPNMRFDLAAGPQDRFWPREEDSFELDDDAYAATLDAIVGAVRKFSRSLTDAYEVSLSMSGGFDSRAIYACVDNETRHGFAQIFTHINTRINWIDAVLAEKVCGQDRLGIDIVAAATRNRMLSEEARARAARAYQIANGTDQTPPRAIIHGTYAGVLENSIVLRGQQIPILKGLFVNRMHWSKYTSAYLAGRVVRLVGHAESPEASQAAIYQAAVDLIETYPDSARPRLADLLFVEAVNGPDLATLFGGHSRAFYMSPFNSREMIRLLACFETLERKSMEPFYHLLFRADPKICNVPFVGHAREMARTETPEAFSARLFEFRALRRSYHEKTGDTAPRISGGPFSMF